MSIAENGGTATLTARLNEVASTNTTVTLTYTGTATNGTNYSSAAATITIPQGTLEGTVLLTGLDDTRDEENETIITDIDGVSGGNGATEDGTQQVTVTIIDDEPAPALFHQRCDRG